MIHVTREKDFSKWDTDKKQPFLKYAEQSENCPEELKWKYIEYHD